MSTRPARVGFLRLLEMGGEKRRCKLGTSSEFKAVHAAVLDAPSEFGKHLKRDEEMKPIKPAPLVASPRASLLAGRGSPDSCSAALDRAGLFDLIGFV